MYAVSKRLSLVKKEKPTLAETVQKQQDAAALCLYEAWLEAKRLRADYAHATRFLSGRKTQDAIVGCLLPILIIILGSKDRPPPAGWNRSMCSNLSSLKIRSGSQQFD